MSRGILCIVHRHEGRTAQHSHHLQPKSRGGIDAAVNRCWLCANAHGDVHYFLDLIEKYRGPENVPWLDARTFWTPIRTVAIAGWKLYAADFLAGKWDRHAAVWSTSGEPWPGNAAPPYAVAEAMGQTWRWISSPAGGSRSRAPHS